MKSIINVLIISSIISTSSFAEQKQLVELPSNPEVANVSLVASKSFNSYEVAGSLVGKTGSSAEATLKEYGFVYSDDPGTQEINGLTIKIFSQEESFEFCIIATKGGSVVMVAFNVAAGDDDYYGEIFAEAMEKFENSAIAAGFKLKQPAAEETDEEKDFHNSAKKQKIYIEYDGSSEAWVYIYNEAIDISGFKQ